MELVSITYAARQVGLERKTIERRIQSGLLRSWSFGPKSTRVDLREVKALLIPS